MLYYKIQDLDKDYSLIKRPMTIEKIILYRPQDDTPTFDIATFSKMPLSLLTPSIMKLCLTTLSITTFSIAIRKCNSQNNDNQ